MAGRISDDSLAAVKDRTDIVQVVSEYLTLKRAGGDRQVGLCPFHQEKTPSFGVTPSKGVYYCHGCGAGGDAITFLREIEHLSFNEAIERLANRIGVQLQYEGDTAGARRAAERRNSLFHANEEAAALYREALLDPSTGEAARAYLAGRGIGPELAETFGIGFAPEAWDFLLRRLASRKDLSPEILREAGLTTGGDDGAVRDRFRGRIVFPIHDLQGRGIGFGGRSLPRPDGSEAESAGPKYLNTSETPFYKKHEVLYNLHRARGAIARARSVFVVEGYTDVIGMAGAGVENAVATCGTALGEGHVRQLARFAERAVLAFDSDEAGARAAERAFAFQEAYPAVQLVVMILPDGMDPADFVAAEGGEAILAAADRSRPLVEYMIRRVIGRHATTSVEARTAAAAEVLPILQRLSDPVRRSEYAHLAADLAGVSDASVLAALGTSGGGRPKTQRGGEVAATVTSPRRLSAREKVEREMLRLLAQDQGVFDAYAEHITDEHLTSAVARDALAAMRERGGDVAAIAGGDDQTLASLVSALTVEPLQIEDGQSLTAYADKVWERLQEFVLGERSEQMRAELQRLNPITDDGYDELFLRLVEVDAELRSLRQGRSAP